MDTNNNTLFKINLLTCRWGDFSFSLAFNVSTVDYFIITLFRNQAFALSSLAPNSDKAPLCGSRLRTFYGLCQLADGETRTPDLLITNQLLYHLSHIGIIFNCQSSNPVALPPSESPFFEQVQNRSPTSVVPCISIS